MNELYKPDLKKIRSAKTDRERNFIERLEFIKFWANYVKTHGDEEWSKQQNVLIDSQIIIARRFYKKLGETEEGRKKIKELLGMTYNKE